MEYNSKDMSLAYVLGAISAVVLALFFHFGFCFFHKIMAEREYNIFYVQACVNKPDCSSPNTITLSKKGKLGVTEAEEFIARKRNVKKDDILIISILEKE